MGELLSKPPLRAIDKNLYFQLRQNKLKDLMECLETINDSFPSQHYFEYSEFDEVFGPLLPDTEPMFNYICEETKDTLLMAEIYESLSCFCLFTSNSFEEKAKFLFHIFDFDRSGSLQPKELVMTFQAVLRVLCKVAGLPIPAFDVLEMLATNCFYKIDRDVSNSIEFDEFYKWTLDNLDLQEFLLKYTGSQTITYAKKRYDRIMLHYMSVYDLVGSSESKGVTIRDLRSVLNKDLANYDKKAIDYFWEIMRNSVIEQTLTPEERRAWLYNKKKLHKGKSRHPGNTVGILDDSNKSDSTVFEESLNYNVDKTTYTDLISAWVAFTASDVSNHNLIVVDELKLLLWLFEGEEPNEFYLKSTMIEIDSNRSGMVDRAEWIDYLCGGGDNSGGQVFLSKLKRIFNKYDKDLSGCLSFKECKLILNDCFREFLGRTMDEESLLKMRVAISELTSEILSEIDENNDGQIQWPEFKLFIDKAMEKTSKLKSFLKSNV